MSRIVQPLEPENVKDVNVVDVPPIFEYQKILGETIVAKDEAKVSEINANTYATQAKTIANNLPTLVNDYVAEHKEELKGKDGKDGVDGKDGKDGINGVDGKSVTVIKNDNGADVVDGYGNVVTITNGVHGKNGVDGADGKSVSVIEIDNGARIIDGNGNVVDVLNGKDGEIPEEKLQQIDSNTELLNQELLQIQRLNEENKNQQRQIDFLHDMTEGIAWRKEIDSAEGYQKAIPKGAKGVTVNSIGGKCLVVNQGVAPLTSNNYIFENGVNGVFDSEGVTYTNTIAKNGLKARGAWVESLMTFLKLSNKYYIGLKIKVDREDVVTTSFRGHYVHLSNKFNVNTTKNIYSTVIECIENVNYNAGVVYVYCPNANLTIKLHKIVLVNLTQWYGAGNEPTAEEFEKENPWILNDVGIIEPTIKTICCDCVEIKGKNWYNVEQYPMKKGSWVHADMGNISTNAEFQVCMDFVPCVDLRGKQIVVAPLTKGANPGIAFYDDNKIYLNGVANNSNTDKAIRGTSISVPINASYLKFSTNVDANPYIVITDDVNVSYSPYNVQQLTIPTETEMYSAGNAYDTKEYFRENGKLYERYTQRIGKVDFNDIRWDKFSDESNLYRFEGAYPSAPPKMVNQLVPANLVFAQLQTDTYYKSPGSHIVSISIRGNNPNFKVLDDTCDTVAKLKAKYNGYIYYELAEPIVTTIELPADWENNCECEGGGSITFKNTLGDDYRVPIPNELEYYVKVSEAL